MRTNRPRIAPLRLVVAFIVLWCIAELCAFALIVSFLGFGGAFLLGLLTSLIGFSLLRRLGQGAARNLKQILESRGLVFGRGLFLDATLAAFGAALLILPGFLSDLAGLALSLPSIRRGLTNWFKGKAAATQATRNSGAGDRVIDLGAQDWRRIDEAPSDVPGHL